MSNQSRKSKEVVVDYYYNWPCGHEEKLGGDGDFFSHEPNLADQIHTRQNLGSPGYECPFCTQEQLTDPWFDRQGTEQPSFGGTMAEETRFAVTAALQPQLDKSKPFGTHIRKRRNISRYADALQSELNKFKFSGTYARSLQDSRRCSENLGYQIQVPTKAKTRKLIEELEAALSRHPCHREEMSKHKLDNVDPPTARRQESRYENDHVIKFERRWQSLTESLHRQGLI